LAFSLTPIVIPFLGLEQAVVPKLPLRDRLKTDLPPQYGPLPDAVLDAQALRPLMDAIQLHVDLALAEFDGVFGERA
jgi:hypothetical protein